MVEHRNHNFNFDNVQIERLIRSNFRRTQEFRNEALVICWKDQNICHTCRNKENFNTSPHVSLQAIAWLAS